jgi:hypothetical protein
VDLLAAIGFSLVGSGGGVLLASPLLLLRRDTRLQVVPDLISYAVGALLGVALLKLVPEALESVEASTALGALLAGILTFFMLEKLVLWRHCHTADCDAHDTSATLILIGAVCTGVRGREFPLRRHVRLDPGPAPRNGGCRRGSPSGDDRTWRRHHRAALTSAPSPLECVSDAESLNLTLDAER